MLSLCTKILFVCVSIHVTNCASSTCNWGLWSVGIPLVDGECSYFNGSISSSSVALVCANDGNSAIINEYDNLDCTGTPCNTEDCNVISAGISYYGNGNIWCAYTVGDAHHDTMYLSPLDGCFDYQSGNINVSENVNSVQVSTSTNGLFVDVYNDAKCDGDIYSQLEIVPGCYSNGKNTSDGNSTRITFEDGDSDTGTRINSVDGFNRMTFVAFVVVMLALQS